jgi:hypothetical protein
MSPASRGIVPGLFLALLAASCVLAMNRWWLFPALEETGVRYLAAAPDLATGHAPAIPLARWDAVSPTSGLEGEGKLMPLLMAAAVKAGARAHVAGLWTLAGSAALAVVALSWAVGGVAGAGGALAIGLLVLCAPPGPAAATLLGPVLLLAALVALLLGTMVYQPRWSAAHGTLAALAWLAHPAGVGAVAAAVLWPATRGGRPREKVRSAFWAAAAPFALLAAGAVWPILDPPAGGASSKALGGALQGIVRGAGAGVGGWVGMAAGIVMLAALGALTLAEARSTPVPPGDIHWSDPAAPDLLAARFRPAAGLLALASVVGAAWAPGTATPWLPSSWVLLALAAAVAVRWRRRARGPLSWAPLVVLIAWAVTAGWSSWGELRGLRQTGRGVTSVVWVASPVIRWIDNRSRPWAEIYASDPALVLLQTGRAARSLPVDTAEWGDFARRFEAHPGAIVLTGEDDVDLRADALRARLGLTEVVRAPEGRVLVPATHDPGGRP